MHVISDNCILQIILHAAIATIASDNSILQIILHASDKFSMFIFATQYCVTRCKMILKRRNEKYMSKLGFRHVGAMKHKEKNCLKHEVF